MTEDIITALQRENTALKARLAEFEQLSRQLDLVIQATGVGIWDWDVPSGATVFNERWANIIGYTLAEVSPLSIDTWIRFAHPDDLKESEQRLKAHWEGKTPHYIFESRMKHKDGRWVWVYDTGKVIEWTDDGKPKRMIGTHLDITDRKEAELRLASAHQKLVEMSFLDSLTRIPNRRAFDKKLAELIPATRRAKSTLALLVIDIDYFKQFNDYYGHEKGDEVLRSVAQKVEGSLARQTDFVARYGGEEIVVILPYTTEEGATMVARRIIDSIARENIEHRASPEGEVLTVSIGIATAGEDFEALFHQADRALYQAKEAGRNGYRVYSEA